MDQQITQIRLPLPLNVSHVNSYLVRTDGGFFLVDTGLRYFRHRLEIALDRLCTHPGDLKLIVITHGDLDHTGNAAYLRGRFNAPIAMHQADARLLEDGDTFWKRKSKSALLRKVMTIFIRFSKVDECSPDVLLEDGSNLKEYGWDATVLNTPGHSAGSICLLTPSGDLLCGDLFASSAGKPRLTSMLDDVAAGQASLARLKTLPIKMVYPGHGQPFAWKALVS